MHALFATFGLFMALVDAVPAAAVSISTAHVLTEALTSRPPRSGKRFDLTVMVNTPPILPLVPIMGVQDESGAVSLLLSKSLQSNVVIRSGDVLHVTGKVRPALHIGRFYAECDTLVHRGQVTPPSPMTVDPKKLDDGFYDNRFILLEGLLRDVFTDEIDPQFSFISLAYETGIIYIAMPSLSETDMATARRMLGARVSVQGRCSPPAIGGRQHIGRYIYSSSLDDVHLLGTPPADPFDVPELEKLVNLRPGEIVQKEHHRAHGRVLAVWTKRNALLELPGGRVIRTSFAGTPAPAVGNFVEVIGYPECDMFALGLTRARWRETKPWSVREHSPKPLTGDSLAVKDGEKPRFDPLLQGCVARLTGRVCGISSDGRHIQRIFLQDNARLIPIDVSNIDLNEDPQGYLVSVTGICVIDIDNWRPNADFPRIREIFVVTRTPDDIRILSKAPWWTPGRLLSAIGILLASLAGFVLWNRQLARAIDAKGRELELEVVKRIGADFKVGERTRLAVELHDSLSQTLTGVAMRISAANRSLSTKDTVTRRHLDLASRTLASCRSELKNCLWDLRNNALEDDDMAAAIRRIVTPHIGDALLNVRFAALRDWFTDSTAHVLLRIIRELATNAVRHGHATHLQIAGVVEDRTLRISVKDDGCGFDPDAAPGMELGHFGLEGIRERLREFNGSLEIKSAPQDGTRAVITLNLPSEDKD